MKVILFQGRRGWFWRLVAKNGRTLSHSEEYGTRWNARRTAKKVAKLLDIELEEV